MKMEEIERMVIFKAKIMSSDKQQSIGIEIFDSEDSRIISQMLVNDQQSVWKLKTSQVHFYCLLRMEDGVCKDFNFQIPVQFVQNYKIFIQKVYDQLTFKMQIQLSKFNQKVNYQSSDDYIGRYAQCNLKKIESNIWIKLQTQHLKSKLKQKINAYSDRGFKRNNKKHLTTIGAQKVAKKTKTQILASYKSTKEGFQNVSRRKINDRCKIQEDENCQIVSIKKLKKGISSKQQNSIQQEIALQQTQIECNQNSKTQHKNKYKGLHNSINVIKKSRRSFQQHLLAYTFQDLSKQRQIFKLLNCIIKQNPISCCPSEPIKIKRKHKSKACLYSLKNSRICYNRVL